MSNQPATPQEQPPEAVPTFDMNNHLILRKRRPLWPASVLPLSQHLQLSPSLNLNLFHSSQLSQHQANLSQCSHSQAGQWAQCHPSRA